MADLNEMFFQECDELLESLSEGLNRLEVHSGDHETVNGMFRAVHSIKGGAGAFHLDQLVKFAHAFENVLDEVRAGRLVCDENVVALLFPASDHLSDLVTAARSGEILPEAQGASVLSDLQLLCGAVDQPDAGQPEFAPAFQPMTLALSEELPALAVMGDAPNDSLRILFRPYADLYANGHEPAFLFRELEKIGAISVVADLSALSALEQFSCRTPRISWTLVLAPDDDNAEAAVREVFEFTEGLCELSIETVSATPDCGLTDHTSDSLEAQTPKASPPEVLSSGQPAKETVPKPTPKPAPVRTRTIRVDLDRVDHLINLVGELVIAEAMLRQSVDQFQNATNVDEAIGQLKQLSGAIQESVMTIRAQPVRSLFQRMSRIVRETSKDAGKSARLVTIGEGTEVDKTVTERLVDPLTHMIRNAVDHGIETAEIRAAAGKDVRGTVTLEAAHRSGRVVITLTDDGAGINRNKVRQIAEEKGLIQPDDDLTDDDIDNLLFRPGFSTADEVSNLSGRGVGMDVVRNEIQSLGGRVTLSSTPQKGTCVTISLPLTLAVLEGMVVRVAGESLIVPTLPLREMLQPGQATIHRLCEGDEVLALGGALVRITDLGVALGYRKTAQSLEQQSLLLVEGDSGQRAALAVDEIAEQREVVIKGLEQNYQNIPGIAAATILGDGKIALIVDTEQMINLPVAQAPASSSSLRQLKEVQRA